MFLFEKLNVYQKALDFADEIHNISQAFSMLNLCKRRKWLADGGHQWVRDELVEISEMRSGLAKEGEF